MGLVVDCIKYVVGIGLVMCNPDHFLISFSYSKLFASSLLTIEISIWTTKDILFFIWVCHFLLSSVGLGFFFIPCIQLLSHPQEEG